MHSSSRNPNNYRDEPHHHHHRHHHHHHHHQRHHFNGPSPDHRFSGDHSVPLSGRKRGFPFSTRGRSPSDNTDNGSFAKLYIGNVPMTATEYDIRPLFEEHGNVIEVVFVKDKRTGQQKGFCFIKYATSEEAERAIRALHNQYTLPGVLGPIQVRYADGERERPVGTAELKLYVGMLNKQATEKEIKEIFSPYGHVEDVYIMRDELKQSRGCGFVKLLHRDMAVAAINALNGIYWMRGCDHPLIVRFADPKRPKAGESRSDTAFGAPGFGPRFQAQPGFRTAPHHDDPMDGHVPPNASRQISPRNLGPSSQAHDFSGSSVDQPLPLELPIQPLPHLPPSLQLQTQETPAAYSSMAISLAPIQQFDQLQIPASAALYSQAPQSQHLIGLSGHASVSQFQTEQSVSSSAQPSPMSLQIEGVPSTSSQQLPCVPASRQHFHQPLQKSPDQLAQVLSQQTESPQASYPLAQQSLSQMQQQSHLMHQSSQNLTQQQLSKDPKRESPWTGIIQQTTATAPSTAPTTVETSTTPTLHFGTHVKGPLTCYWTEHNAPDGFKYYYNSKTKDSRWEKPEELTLFEQRKKNSSVQHLELQSEAQTASYPQNPSTQASQSQQVQFQTKISDQHQLDLQQVTLSSPVYSAISHQNAPVNFPFCLTST